MLEKNEIMTALSSGASRSDHAKPSKGHKRETAGEMLFKVLDLDDSGTISFRGESSGESINACIIVVCIPIHSDASGCNQS